MYYEAVSSHEVKKATEQEPSRENLHTDGSAAGFPSRLAQAMRKAAKTQAALAAQVGVAPSAVSAWRAGDRNPSRENVTALAKALEVPEPWLHYGVGESPFARDTEADRHEYEERFEWHWQRQQPEGRMLGNAAGFAFDVDMRTLTRETGQNSLDELLQGEQTVDLRYTVIELTGGDLERFLETIKFEELRGHLVAASQSGQKAASSIRAGLEHLEHDAKLILLQISDFNANGLTGPEYDDGRFMAVLRNTLDSQKAETAGGSYGLGKATMWVASRFGLILANSDLSEPVDGNSENRIFGRAEMPWHSHEGQELAGPGWLGVRDEERGVAASYFGNATLADDLYMARPDDRPGATFLIVGAYDPSGSAETIEELAQQIREAAALNFWPAMVGAEDEQPRLKVRVRTQRGSRVVSDTLVDPREYVEPLVDALERYRSGAVVEHLEEIGDVVVESAELTVPERIGDHPHDATEQQAIVLVIRAADDAPEELINRIYYFRGNQMVIREQRPPVPFGAVPFYAVVMAGEAAGDGLAAVHAERFLRAAEPPAHDNWTATPELTTQYARGARQRIVHDFPSEVVKAVKRQITMPSARTSDGPDALKELLRLIVPQGDSSSRPRVRLLTGAPDSNGAWDVRVTVALPPRKAAWQFVPVLKFGTESGAGLPVKWSVLEAIAHCDVVDGLRIEVPADTRGIEFRGVSDPSTHPVAATRSTVYVDFRDIRAEGDDA
jgi:transcriptional regulator with XRE-family HTH domain